MAGGQQCTASLPPPAIPPGANIARRALPAPFSPASGAQGRFRLCCERTLRVLRASARPLAALLEASVADPLVDWEAEEQDRVRRKAYELAAALRLFALQAHGGAAAGLASAAEATEAALAACSTALGGYVQQFQQAAGAAAAATESREVLLQCQVGGEEVGG